MHNLAALGYLSNEMDITTNTSIEEFITDCNAAKDRGIGEITNVNDLCRDTSFVCMRQNFNISC